MRKEIIDISSWQSDISLPTVFNANPQLKGVSVKVSEGLSNQPNPYWKQWAKETRNAGKMVGFYHFCRFKVTKDPVGEAQTFIDTIKGTIKDDDFLMIDEEEGYVPLSQIQAFHDAVKKAFPKNKLLVYGYKSQANGKTGTDWEDKGWDLWISYPNQEPSFRNMRLWQNPSTHIAGYTPAIDVSQIEDTSFFKDTSKGLTHYSVVQVKPNQFDKPIYFKYRRYNDDGSTVSYTDYQNMDKLFYYYPEELDGYNIHIITRATNLYKDNECTKHYYNDDGTFKVLKPLTEDDKKAGKPQFILAKYSGEVWT